MSGSPRIYEGDVSLQRIDLATNQPTGPEVILNCDAFAPGSEEAETQQLISKKLGTYGQALAEVTTPGSATLSATFNEFDAFLYEIIFRGEGSEITQTAASFSAEEQTVTALDQWLPIVEDVGGTPTNRYQLLADPAVVVTDNADPTPAALTLGTDYEIDRKWGRIKFLSTGSVSVDDIVLVSASYAAFSATKIVGNVKPNARFRVVFNGRDRISGKFFLINAWDANLAPASDPDLLGSEFVAVELAGSMLVPSGRPGPYEVISQN